MRVVEALIVYPGVALHIPNAVYDEYGTSQAVQTKALKAFFDKHTHGEDFVAEWRVVRSETYTIEDRIVESAGSADIVVMAAVRLDDERSAHVKLLESVIRDCGRPVLVVPTYFQSNVIGQSVLIGWNGSREAVRAAHDALLLLQAGGQAHIVNIYDSSSSSSSEPEIATRELAAAFARHGIETTVVQRTWTKPGVTAALNMEAFERGADMIAIGAFGHSRAYDLVIGAATRNLLRHSDLPVMFSR